MSAIDDVLRHEGFRTYPYVDTMGHLTIGHGINLDAGITQDESMMIVKSRLATIEKELAKRLPFFDELTQNRKDVLINMAYNLGIQGLMNFVRTLNLIGAGNYDAAAKGMMDSLWARQVKGRAAELADKMRRG